MIVSRAPLPLKPLFEYIFGMGSSDTPPYDELIRAFGRLAGEQSYERAEENKQSQDIVQLSRNINPIHHRVLQKVGRN